MPCLSSSINCKFELPVKMAQQLDPTAAIRRPGQSTNNCVVAHFIRDDRLNKFPLRRIPKEIGSFSACSFFFASVEIRFQREWPTYVLGLKPIRSGDMPRVSCFIKMQSKQIFAGTIKDHFVNALVSCFKFEGRNKILAIQCPDPLYLLRLA